MKLNIYENKNIVKTYTAERYDLMLGTLEDVANAVKIDELKTGSDKEILMFVFDLVKSSMGTVKELMHEVFDGITDEELRKTKVSEIVTVISEIVKITITELGKGFGKN